MLKFRLFHSKPKLRYYLPLAIDFLYVDNATVVHSYGDKDNNDDSQNEDGGIKDDVRREDKGFYSFNSVSSDVPKDRDWDICVGAGVTLCTESSGGGNSN